MSTSSDEDDLFFRNHAKEIAEALQKQDEQAVQSAAPKNQSQRERMVHDTYVALCHDDPQVESDLACQYLATALLDPKSPYALSGPLVEGIRQLCARQQGAPTSSKGEANSEETSNLTNNTASSTPIGCAMLAWAIYARIPLLCCQATDISDIHHYLGSYRPPPPPDPLALQEDTQTNSTVNTPEKHQEADRLAEMLSQPQGEENVADNNAKTTENNNGLEEEVWAAESDPSDFEFETGFSYEQQMTDFNDAFAAWMLDRSDPLKLSKPTEGTTWKQVRHAVMDLISQLNYRQVSSLWNNRGSTATSVMGGRGPADILTQLTMTMLVPPPGTSSRPSIFDSPDDEEDAIQPERQLQAMAWHPLWCLRDASSQQSSSLSQYLTLLQTLLAVDAAASKPTTEQPMAPATYVGLASLSALCQKFVVDTVETATTSSHNTERFRALRLALWEISDDLSHALEQEERFAAKADDKNKTSDWIVWTLLPLFEILTNQRLQTGTTIVAKAESMAQRHHSQQSSQQWSGLLQSGLFRQWLLILQALKGEEEEKNPLLWHLMRRSLLHTIGQSMSATSALGKYAWRFPNFVSVVESGVEAPKVRRTDSDLSFFAEHLVDDILWHLLSMELSGGAAAAGPTIQWKSKKTTTVKPLPTRDECQRHGWEDFQSLCSSVVRVLDLACQEENKKENLATTNAAETKEKDDSSDEETAKKVQWQVVLQSFHRFVDSVVACPLLAKVFVHDLEMTDDGSKSITKCLDSIQESLSQYKAPERSSSKSSRKAKEEDGDNQTTEEIESRRTKEQVQDASLQEDIHTVRKVLKVLRSLLSTKTAPGPTATAGGMMTSMDVTSSSKTD